MPACGDGRRRDPWPSCLPAAPRAAPTRPVLHGRNRQGDRPRLHRGRRRGRRSAGPGGPLPSPRSAEPDSPVSSSTTRKWGRPPPRSSRTAPRPPEPGTAGSNSPRPSRSRSAPTKSAGSPHVVLLPGPRAPAHVVTHDKQDEDGDERIDVYFEGAGGPPGPWCVTPSPPRAMASSDSLSARSRSACPRPCGSR